MMKINKFLVAALIAVPITVGVLMGINYVKAANGSVEICEKRSGFVYVIGEGFRRQDCTRNDRLITINTEGVQGPKGDKGDTVTNQIIETIIEKTPIVTVKEVAVADTPKVIVSKLESLEDEDKLKISAIKNLRDELDKLEKKIKLGGRVIYSGNGGGGKIVKAEDISSQLNGVLKTFSLPAFFRVISIHSSSFPNAFRLTTDYTVDGSAFTVSFSSEIDASTVLSAGQTVIVLFSEM